MCTNSSSDLSDSETDVPNNLIPMSARNNPYHAQAVHQAQADNIAHMPVNTPMFRKHLR